jgi:WD40 repeat protein
VFGTVAKREDCYDDLKATRSAWDSNYVCANPLFFAVLYESGGGGSFAVIPWGAGKALGGKVDPKLPLVCGHKSAVLDIDFNPFNDTLIASASEDCSAKIWGIPEGGLTQNLTEPLQTLSGHRRKVGTIKFNPVANNILATSGTDYAVKLWDVEKGQSPLSIDAVHADIINCCEWNFNGSLLATSCKDKKIRVLDPRKQSAAQEVEGHQGVKGGRVCWLGARERILSVGFSKTSEREYCLWDPREFSKPVLRQGVDSASGLLMPFYDNDTSLLFLAGKGDGNIRYYEVVDESPFAHYISEYKSSTPQRGMAMLPKRGVNVSENEIVKILKLGTKIMEPISFQVPRKSDMFQDDIFPDCASGEPALTSQQWLSGENSNPKTMSLAPGFVQKKAVAEFNPEKVEEQKPMSDKELREEVEKLQKRVAYLEAELIKRDAKIKELSGQ